MVDGEKSLQEMFAMVEASGQLPKTSQPGIGRFLDVFTELAADGKKSDCDHVRRCFERYCSDSTLSSPAGHE